MTNLRSNIYANRQQGSFQDIGVSTSNVLPPSYSNVLQQIDWCEVPIRDLLQKYLYKEEELRMNSGSNRTRIKWLENNFVNRLNERNAYYILWRIKNKDLLYPQKRYRISVYPKVAIKDAVLLASLAEALYDIHGHAFKAASMHRSYQPLPYQIAISAMDGFIAFCNKKKNRGNPPSLDIKDVIALLQLFNLNGERIGETINQVDKKKDKDIVYLFITKVFSSITGSPTPKDRAFISNIFKEVAPPNSKHRHRMHTKNRCV